MAETWECKLTKDIRKTKEHKSLGQLSESRTMQLKSRLEHKRDVFLEQWNPSFRSSNNKSF